MPAYAEMLTDLCSKHSLSEAQAAALFASVIAGQLSDIELAGLLVALKAKGETPEEFAGAAQALRQAALSFPRGEDEVVDTCGTGGDGSGSVNISTAVALLGAELGLRVAKHGNRSISSRCGSADVLEQCGVKIDAAPEVSARCLRDLRICFLFAPQYHAGIRHAMPVRKALGVRTMFNMVGPLANPARPEVQLMGVYDPALCVPVAQTLALLGCRSALVVHGAGLDEVASHGPTTVAVLRGGFVETMIMAPEDAGFERRPIEVLRGGDPGENARWLKELLAGRGRAEHNEMVALNAGALLWLAGRASDWPEGCAEALACLGRGKAR